MSRAAELIASFSPFERGVLENAIDQFLGRLGGLDTDLSHLSHSANLIPNVIAAAVAVSLAEAFRRRLRRPEEDGGAAAGRDDDDFASPGLPGRPERWALEELWAWKGSTTVPTRSTACSNG